MITKESIYNFSNKFYDEKEKKTKYGIAFYKIPEESFDDVFYVIQKEEEFRPDLLSEKFYGSPFYDWLICINNGIKDPLKELTKGKRIVIPDINNYL